jgi:DNA-binding NarL/FixJ family response regulator
MQSTNVVLLQSDPNIARTLAAQLANSFHAVHLTKSIEELRNAAAKLRPRVMIVDLETATYSEIESLKQQFESTRIICNHRVADEEMWTRTLTIGADDCCPSSDTRSILSSATPQLTPEISATSVAAA